MSEHDDKKTPIREVVNNLIPNPMEVMLGDYTLGLSGTEQTVRNKRNFLNCLQRSLGVIQPACEKANVGRSTVAAWREDDPVFAAAVFNVKEIRLDYAESQLMARMKTDTSAVKYFLNNHGKKRGYSSEKVITNRNIDCGKEASMMTDDELEDKIRQEEQAEGDSTEAE